MRKEIKNNMQEMFHKFNHIKLEANNHMKAKTMPVFKTSAATNQLASALECARRDDYDQRSVHYR